MAVPYNHETNPQYLFNTAMPMVSIEVWNNKSGGMKAFMDHSKLSRWLSVVKETLENRSLVDVEINNTDVTFVFSSEDMRDHVRGVFRKLGC